MISQLLMRGMAAGLDFSKMNQQITKFFMDGIGGDLANALGTAILVIGLIAAGISFAVHKFNPQSRMPGWISCLVIAVVGAMVVGGVAGPMKLITDMKDTIYGWLGI